MVKTLTTNEALNKMAETKSGAFAVVVYSSSYSPAVEILLYVKEYLVHFPTIQLIALNIDEDRQVIAGPFLNVTEVPTVLLYWNGRPFCHPLTEISRVEDRLRRLAIRSMEIDTFESQGTVFSAPFSVIEPKKSAESSSSVLTPLFQLLDPLYDV